jgi:hypothetical protein
MEDIYIVMKAKVIIKRKARGEDNTAQANDSESIQNVRYVKLDISWTNTT